MFLYDVCFRDFLELAAQRETKEIKEIKATQARKVLLVSGETKENKAIRSFFHCPCNLVHLQKFKNESLL